MSPNDYERLATVFLTEYGIAIHADLLGDKCPPWCKGEHLHGGHYSVSVMDIEEKREPLVFDFWESETDKDSGGRPNNYTLLSLIGATIDADPLNGDEATFQRIAEFTDKARKFFQPHELEKLRKLFD